MLLSSAIGVREWIMGEKDRLVLIRLYEIFFYSKTVQRITDHSVVGQVDESF